VIFAELLHAENFTQSRPDAKKFLTRISPIDFVAETFERVQNHEHQMKKRISLVMKKLRLFHFLLLLITSTMVVSSAVGQESKTSPIPADQKLYLKDYDAQTNKIRAGFIPYKAEVVLGEPLQVTFSVENLGLTNFQFWFGGDYRGTGCHDRFKIAVTNANGEALPDPIAHVWDFGGFIQHVNLKLGQLFTNVIDLTTFRVIDKPGIYTVSCSFAFYESGVKKDQTNPVVNTTFTLTILERTPERVSRVLDELVAKAQATHGQDLGETLALIASFGKEDALPRLAQLAKNGSLELRAAAIGALPLIPTDASVDVALASLKDSDPTIREAAASSLGAMQMPRGVDALLDALAKEKSPVAEAIVLALGTSKSDRAFSVITNILDAEEIEMQMAAVNALVNFGGSNAVTALTSRINTNYLSLRYEIVLALAEKLRQPMQADWLQPVLTGRELNHEWLDSLLRLALFFPTPAAGFFLIAEIVAVPVRIEAEVFEHLQIFFNGLVQRGEIIAYHQRARAGHENHALRVAQVHGAAAGDHDFLSRQNKTEARDGLQNFHHRQRLVLGERRAGNGIEDVNGHDVRADGLEFKREVAAVFARLAHADDAAGTNLDAGLFQMADGLQPVLERVRGAGLREKAARAFEIVAVTFKPGFLQAVGDFLFLDDAERGVGARFAAGFQFADAVADFIQHRAFVQSFPGGDQTDSSDGIFICFVGSFGDGFGINESVSRRAGLVMRRLRAEAAILGTRAGLGIDDGAKMDFVALEMFSDAVRPRQQIKNVGGRFEIEEPQRIVARDLSAA
jgi:hypothetical protein